MDVMNVIKRGLKNDGRANEYGSTSSSSSSEKSSSDESSSESVFTDDDVNNPGFQGKLAAGEKWLQCPYDKNHYYLSTKDAKHIVNCRRKYLETKVASGQPVDIRVCRFMASHHFHVDDIEEHELECGSQNLMLHCLDYFTEIPRYSKVNRQQRKEARKQKMKEADEKKQAKEKKGVKDEKESQK